MIEENFGRNFKIAHNLATFTFIVNLVLVILLLVFIVWGSIWSINSVREHGLKSCVERVWNGPTNNVEKSL